MALKFIPSAYKGGRIVARSGDIDVGGIFVSKDGSAEWRLWFGGTLMRREGRSKSELAARNALATAWSNLLRSAALIEKQQVQA